MVAYPQFWISDKSAQVTSVTSNSATAGNTTAVSSFWIFNDKGAALGGTSMSGWRIETEYYDGVNWLSYGHSIVDDAWIQVAIVDLDNTGGGAAAQTTSYTALGAGRSQSLTAIPQNCGRKIDVRVVTPLGAPEGTPSWRLKVTDDVSDPVILTSTGDARYVRALTRSSAIAATTAVTTEETLWTYSLPGGSLATNGAAIRVTAVGLFASNANTKTVRFYFGAHVITQNDVTTAPNGVSFRAEVIVSRDSAVGQYLCRSATVGTVNQNVAVSTPGETLANAITVKITGQNGTASANDIVLHRVIVDMVP